MKFLDLLCRRYACRRYRKETPIEPEKLDIILQAARLAPTAANRQPQRLLVIQSTEGLERLTRCTRDFGAPCAIIVCADISTVWSRKYDDKKVGDIDATIITDHMMLTAASLDLDTLWVCMFNPESLRKEFSIPDHLEPVNILLIGYGDGLPSSPDRHADLRKPLTETTFFENF